ncbi:hypothetical protein GK047_15275 [Paenibacillus sp. SYP-B3998]|uniref:Uncharacterized protein n=1 Tax=Paenibacillus sp. SYP-B3998 TaxID=2678564 RepID=A0A6G4A099_9BACL|nr:hypothetical protein [Paenibacillus sp. SYP-B3998]NEW07364.1 hypothetical protein [Paenibacillus sp. SYP-B3998]
MSNKAKLSQHTAIMLERARRFGISDTVLLNSAVTGDINPFQPAVAQYYSYDDFFTYAKTHGESIEEAIRNGYRMKFNTPGGLQIWLKDRFGLEAGVDFEATTGRLDGLKLSAEDMEVIRETVAVNWVLLETNTTEGQEGQSTIQAGASVETNSTHGNRAFTLVISSLLESN